MTNNYKYEFSFTASSLRLREMILVATHFQNGTVIDYVNELGNGKTSTGKRMLAEFNKRIEVLTDSQIELLVNGDFITQKHIAYLSVCKAYRFLRDFIVEVLREKYLIFDYVLSEGEYISFYRRKSEFHPEMDELTDLSEKKVKQVTFKILEQAGIIDSIKSRNLQPQLLDDKVINVILADNPEWLKMFFYSDMNISNLTI